MSTFVCEKCGKTVLRTSNNQRQCPSCRYSGLEPRIVGKPMKCCDCGAIIICHAKQQLRCRDCADIAHRERSRTVKYRPAKRKALLDAKNAEAEKKKKKSLSELAFEARVLGLSYGEYAKLYDTGQVYSWCAEHGINAKNELEKAKRRRKREAERNAG